MKKLITLSAILLSVLSYAQNTHMIQDINKGPSGSTPQNFTVFKDELFFITGSADHELRKYDGTTVSLIKDINTIGPSEPNELTVMGDELLFSANDGRNRRGLWKYNGLNYSLVMKQAAGYLTVMGNELFFNADDKLWKYDGTNTILIKDIDIEPRELIVMRDELFFAGYTHTDGRELWKYDGTNVTLVKNINTNKWASSSPTEFTVMGDKLFFNADDGINGIELWLYDGTNTTLVKDINPFGDSNPTELTVMGDELFFKANDGTHGIELWKYDGTNTTLVKDINPSGDSDPTELTVMGNELFFRADDSTHGVELWKYDGVKASLVKDILSPGSSNPISFIVMGNELFFRAWGGDRWHPGNLWKYDGTNTILVYPVAMGSFNADDKNSNVIMGNDIFFSGWDPEHGFELWKHTPTVTSINNYQSSNSIKIYPNPTKNKITLEGNLNNTTVTISSIEGKQLQRIKTQENKIELSIKDLIPGVYFVNIQKETEIETIKIIKK